MSYKVKKNKVKLFTLTRKDFRWDFYRCPGKGGQHVNKVSTGVRCVHEPSKASGRACDHKSRHKNRQLAFKRMAETKEFKNWVKFKGLKMMGVIDQIEQEIKLSLANPRNLKIEVKDEKGRWVEVE